MTESSDVTRECADTLRWRGDALELLDQRVLPNEVRYVRCTTSAAVAEAIRAMVVRGAPAIGCAAAYGIALAAKEAAGGGERIPEKLDQAAEMLAATRPTAINLRWALERMRACWGRLEHADAATVAAVLLAEATAIRDEDIAANRAMGALGAALLADSCRVLTHCNAGALATAGHGTALGVVRSAVAAGKRIEVIADETRPFLQGARLTAWELQRDGIPVTLIADSAAGYVMSRGLIDAVIVGADRVAANGDVANKIGTYPLAALAQRHGIPFYVACPVSTLDPQVATGADIPIEERDPEELTGFAELRWAPAGVAARNPAFDITPAELVSALITERGIATPPFGPAIARLLAGGAIRAPV
jgi:methylthioribose-1-phosphate isomerase